MMFMTTTTVRPAIHERLDPALEAMITRELIGQGAPPSAISGAQQQPGAQFAALAPALIAAMASQQPQQIPVPQPPSLLATLFPALAATVAMQQQPARPSPLVSALSAALAPAIASAITGRPREGREREAGEGSERPRR